MVVLRLNQHSFRFCHEETNPPQEKKIYGNWFIYKSWQFLGTKTLRTSIKRYRRVAKSSKPRLHNSICTGTNIVKIWLSLCLIGCVRFAKHCGKMYGSHLFSYCGFSLLKIRKVKFYIKMRWNTMFLRYILNLAAMA